MAASSPVLAPPAQRAVVVLGFHRSGTSMLTRLLNLLGVELGPAAELLGAVEGDNARGYFEPVWLIELNDAILAATGGSDWRPPALPAGWERDPRLAALRRQAHARLDNSFEVAPLWGIKDPRLCLTLPFWQVVFAERGIEPGYVVAVRSPLESAASMARRDCYPGTDTAHWGRVWLDYTARALDATTPAERTLVFYDDMLDRGESELTRVADALGLAWPDGGAAEELRAAIEPGLRNHGSTLAGVAGDERLPAAVRSAYLSLRAARDARRSDPEHADALERVAVDLWRESR